MKLYRCFVIGALCFATAGCATWSTSRVDASRAENTVAVAARTAEDVQVYESDVAGRRYEALGDLSVTVNKTTIFHPSPTQQMVEAKLREEAAKLGADAVIFATYGTVGVSLMSWGSMDGRGRAIRFLD